MTECVLSLFVINGIRRHYIAGTFEDISKNLTIVNRFGISVINTANEDIQSGVS